MKPEVKVEIDEYGTKKWYLAGNLHREDGPAIEFLNGGKVWYMDGLLHRESGPAIEWVNGSKQWWLNGRSLTKEEWFDYLSTENKDKALFSEHFIIG